MSAIRDDGGVVAEPNMWDSGEQFLDTVRRQASELMLDRTDGQKIRQVVICEAAGMVPQLERVAHPFGVTVMSGGGFDSTTDKHNFAADLAGQNRPTWVHSIGDHDASGVSMFLAFLEDVEAFTRDLGGVATFTRLAVTPEQIATYGLPTAPPRSPTDALLTATPVRPKHSLRMFWLRSCATLSRRASTSEPSIACGNTSARCGGS
jgi:hypothetical protein